MFDCSFTMMLGLVVGLMTIVLIYVSLKSLIRTPLREIRGPKSSSFLLGNLLELFQHSVGQTDFEWQNLYGDVVRFKTVFGEDQLLISDPKALQKILNSSAHNFPLQPNLRVISRMLVGTGITWAVGKDHQRQRNVLLPGFGGPETKAFLHIFKECAESLCIKWMQIICDSPDQKAIIDVPAWLSRGTLDAIGQAAFDVQFGSVQNDKHPLARIYKNIVIDVIGRPSAQPIFVQAVSKYFPSRLLEWVTDHGSNSRLNRARGMKRMTTDAAKGLLREKAQSLLAGEESRGIFSLLVKANMDTEAKNKLTEEELLSQMRTILLAGVETPATMMSWILLELARHPEMQSRLRAEIRTMEAAIQARGNTQFTIADYDAMPYTTAVIKEGLRYHPVVPHVHRIAGGDDIVSLARPITTESGEAIDEIAVPKGTRITVSITAYNRNKDLWGEDAHEFNPDRWLDGATRKKKDHFGVYSNLMTFSGGARACLGWRFAVIEIQTFLVEIVGRFEFAMTERSELVYRGPGAFMVPVVEGELGTGSQLPLAVSVAAREDDA